MWYKIKDNTLVNLEMISVIKLIHPKNSDNWDIDFYASNVDEDNNLAQWVRSDTPEEARVEFEKITKMLIEKGA